MSSNASEVLRRLIVGEPPVVAETVRDFLSLVNPRTAALASEADRALAGGLAADRLGFAFAAGYQAALRRLLGDRASSATSLAATEEGGAHPRAIQTRLVADRDHFTLSGEKIWSTLAEEAERVLVIATEGERDGRPSLRAVLVPTVRDGVSVERMPDAPFAPEVHHARLRFTQVHIDPGEVLPGDGYDELLKPFRTIEDVHVLCATIGYLSGEGARQGWDRSWRARLAAAAVTARALAHADPGAAETHLALGGLFAELGAIVSGLDPSFERAAGDVGPRWLRDKPLLRVASKVREARLARAWDRLTR